MLRRVVPWLLPALAAALLARAACVPDAGLRVGTWNIRDYGTAPTDERRLVELLDGLDADVLAVQEIRAPDRFATLLGRLDRRYGFVASGCGGRSRLHVGFAWAVDRVRHVAVREYPELDPDGGGRCTDGGRPGLVAEFEADGERFALLVVHFAAGAEPDKAAARRRQWELALRIVDRERARVPAIAVIGDVNSAGWLDDRLGERTFVRERVAAAGLRVLTDDAPCTAYHRAGADHLAPSTLDHLVVAPEFPVGPEVEVGGYCGPARCRPIPTKALPDDYLDVSDHCPVVAGD